MNKILVVICSLFFTVCSMAQSVVIIDAENKEPIEEVYIYSSEAVAFSNKKGLADLSEFKIGSVVNLQHSAYVDKTVVVSNRTLRDTVELQSIVFPIDEVVVSANKWEQKAKEIPMKVVRIKTDAIRQSTAQTTADLLKSSNQVFIQKSQMGGGCPMIRGFAANRVLLVLDGVRLNNAIYRSGNLQNVINIDPNSLEETEVILGPGSVIYGSDAIGGVMDFHTIKPKFSTSEKLNTFLNYKNRLASAGRETTNHVDYNIGSERLSFAGSLSYSKFGDLKMGSHGYDSYLRPNYVIHKDGKDKIVENSSPEKQLFSGYNQFNSVQKIRYKVSENTDLSYGFHYTISSDIPRYDRLIQTKKGKLKYAEWYYGPQKLQLHTLKLQTRAANLFYDSFRLTAGYQHYEESRNDRKLNKPELRIRTEKLDIFTLNADAEKRFNDNIQFFYGAEYTHDKLGSSGYKKNIKDYTRKEIASRYPDNSKLRSMAFYGNLKWKFAVNWVLNTGMRYSHSWINAGLDKNFYDFPFSNLDMNTGAVNGCLGIACETSNGWLFKLNGTTGFRAPNIDDAAKVFDSAPGKVVVPNKNLKSEYIYNLEADISKKIGRSFYFDFNVFYSYLDNAMTRADYTFNGLDSIPYDGEMSRVQAIVNRDNARVRGMSVLAMAELSDKLMLKGQINYTKGEYKDGSPVRHVAPVFGILELNYKTKRIQSKLSAEYNGEISYKNLADSERSKAYLYAEDDAGNPYSPEWVTLNWHNNIAVTRRLALNFAVENILDKRYRPYSSGICAPGRNFIAGVRIKVD